MTIQEAVSALDSIPGGDGEKCHGDADAVIEQYLIANAPDLAAAYERVVERANFWAYS